MIVWGMKSRLSKLVSIRVAHRLSTVRHVRTRTGEDDGCVDRIRSVYSCDICCRGRYIAAVRVSSEKYEAVDAILGLSRASGPVSLEKVVYLRRQTRDGTRSGSRCCWPASLYGCCVERRA